MYNQLNLAIVNIQIYILHGRLSLRWKEDGFSVRDYHFGRYGVDSCGNEPLQPLAGVSTNKNKSDSDRSVKLSGNDNANLNDKHGDELLGLETPIDIMTDTLDESLLGTPSRGVVAIESMSIDDDMIELASKRSATPAREQDNCESAETPICTKTINTVPAITNKPNTLTQDQATAIKSRLSALLQQASVLTSHNPDVVNDNDDTVLLTGKELETREQQLTSQPRVMLQTMSSRHQDQVLAAQSGQGVSAFRVGSRPTDFRI